MFCSSRWVAKLWRKVCGVTRLVISAVCAAAWQARVSWRVVIGLTGFCPGNSQMSPLDHITCQLKEAEPPA
jgi:hypothetical protein